MKNKFLASIVIFLTFNYISIAQDVTDLTAMKGISVLNSRCIAFNESLNSYDVCYYKLDLNATCSSAYISGVVTIKAKSIVESLNQVVVQLIDQLDVSEILCNGEAVSFTHSNDLITANLAQSVLENEYFTLEIEYSGYSTNDSRGLTCSIHSGWDVPVTWTLSESFHSKCWFPVKESLTDKADSADIFITVPSNLTAVSNGKLNQIVDLGNGFHRFEWISRYPIAYYLISITVAEYQEYNIYCNPVGMDEPLLIQNFIYDVYGCLDYYKEGIDRTAGFIELFSELYGTYPFANEKYGHVMSPFGGGMEHQTVSMMGGFTYTLVSHELAHMWFGDYVTCATWQDIWINEGFASYSEYVAREKQGLQSDANDWMDYAQQRAFQEPTGSVYVPAQEATNESRIFSYNLSYKKGAVILHMLRYELNDDEIFFSILKEFLVRHAHSNATGADFLEVLNELSGEDYQWFFDQWYYGIGYPHFTFSFGRADDSRNYITISQQSSAGNDDIFKTSMDIDIYEGDDVTADRIYISENPQTFFYESSQRITWLYPNPENQVLMVVDNIVSAPMSSNPLNISVGPNPFCDYIGISMANDAQSAKVKVYNTMGKLILTKSFAEKSFRLSTKNIPSGVYILQVESNGKIHTQKVVKY